MRHKWNESFIYKLKFRRVLSENAIVLFKRLTGRTKE